MYAIAYATNAALPSARSNVIADWKNFFTWMHLVLPIRPKMALMIWIGFVARIDPLRAFDILECCPAHECQENPVRGGIPSAAAIRANAARALFSVETSNV
jgi:hypothetical protein